MNSKQFKKMLKTMPFLVKFCEDIHESVQSKYTKNSQLEIPLKNTGIILHIADDGVVFNLGNSTIFTYLPSCKWDTIYLCYDYLGGDECSYSPCSNKIHLDILSYDEFYTGREEDCTIYYKNTQSLMLRDGTEYPIDLLNLKEDELFQLSSVSGLLDTNIIHDSINLYKTFESITFKNKNSGVSFDISEDLCELFKPNIVKLLKGFL